MHGHGRDRLLFEMTLVVMKRLGCQMYLTAGAGVVVCLEHPDVGDHARPGEGVCAFARHEAESLMRIHDAGSWSGYLKALGECGALLDGRAVAP